MSAKASKYTTHGSHEFGAKNLDRLTTTQMLKTKCNEIDQEDLSRIEVKVVSTLAIKVPTSGGFMTILRRGRT